MLKGKRTVIFNIAVFVGAVLADLLSDQFRPFLAKYGPNVIEAITLAGIILRAYTTTPLFKDGTQKTNG